MSKTEKYQVLWKCPHCGNDHTWWWEDKWEAYDEGETDMLCDRCEKRSRHKGDGWGFYTCVDDVESNTDRLNEKIKDLYVGLNALTKRLSAIENGEIFDNLSRRMVTAELAITNLEEGVSINTYADRKKKSPEQPSFIDLIHGEKEPFYERFREGCEFNEETMPGESIAKILRFIAVEVERMTERDMGGSFTVSNLTVGRNLRELADQAEIED